MIYLSNYIFTFQYGQIYYKATLASFEGKPVNLHSNMVRFIMFNGDVYYRFAAKFTFQYGQIYYPSVPLSGTGSVKIYIPIWLDLL